MRVIAWWPSLRYSIQDTYTGRFVKQGDGGNIKFVQRKLCSFELFALEPDLLIGQCCHPKAKFDDALDRWEAVF